MVDSWPMIARERSQKRWPRLTRPLLVMRCILASAPDRSTHTPDGRALMRHYPARPGPGTVDGAICRTSNSLAACVLLFLMLCAADFRRNARDAQTARAGMKPLARQSWQGRAPACRIARERAAVERRSATFAG